MVVIQLINSYAIVVDDIEYKKVIKRYKQWFTRFLTVTDVRNVKITVKKRYIILLEEHNEEKIKTNNS